MVGDAARNDKSTPPPVAYVWHQFDIDSAIANKSASFDLWIAVLYSSQEKFNSSPDDRALYSAALAGIYAAFETEHGQVLKLYDCREFRCGAALTRKSPTSPQSPTIPQSPTSPPARGWVRALIARRADRHRRSELHIVFNILDGAHDDDGENSELAKLLYACKQLALQAEELLTGTNLLRCFDLIYWIVTEVGARLDEKLKESSKDTRDAAKIGDEQIRELLQQWNKRFDDAKAFYLRSVKRASDIYYFWGMLIGLGVVFGIGTIVGFVLANVNGVDAKSLIGSFVAGALGAMVSVMSRMTHDKLSLNY